MKSIQPFARCKCFRPNVRKPGCSTKIKASWKLGFSLPLPKGLPYRHATQKNQTRTRRGSIFFEKWLSFRVCFRSHPPWNHGLVAWLAFMSVLILWTFRLKLKTWDCLERRGTLRLGSGEIPGKKQKNLLASWYERNASLIFFHYSFLLFSSEAKKARRHPATV